MATSDAPFVVCETLFGWGAMRSPTPAPLAPAFHADERAHAYYQVDTS